MGISPGPQVRHALFIRFGGMGDILLATPTVRRLADAYPGITIDFIVGGGMAPALEGHPLIRRIYVFDKRGADARFRNFLPFLVRLARARYDLVVNLHPSVKSYLMAAATGARTRLTFRKHMEVRADTGRVAHAVDDFFKELAPLGIPMPTDRRLDFVVPPAAHERVGALLRERGVADTDRLLVINPAGSHAVNRWAPERFAAVAAHFADRPGTKVAVSGAPSSFRAVQNGIDEGDLARSIAEADPRVLNLAGQINVKELGALFQRAGALLTGDTGPMHIAAALETPLVALFGPADPDRTGPLTANAVVLADRSLPCEPCRARVCARGDIMCMQNLSVPAVIAAVDGRLLPRRADRVPLMVL